MEREDPNMSPALAASALQWWAEAGVDVLVDEEPRDWLRAKPKAKPSPVSAPATDALPDQLDLFQAHLKSSETLPYFAPAAPRVCPAGDPASGLMMLTDMPTGEDCRTGTLLSGEVGILFDRMLAAIGRDRASIYLASLSCLRAPSGRLSGDDGKQCAAMARHHVGLAQPKALLLLGDNCTHALLGLGVAQARGRWHQISTHSGQIAALASFHPERLLEQPAFKAAAWADLRLLIGGLN